jgi:hypothetical protein
VKPSFSASTVRPVYDEAAKELKLEHSMRESRSANNQTRLSPTEFGGSRPLPIGKRPGRASSPGLLKACAPASCSSRDARFDDHYLCEKRCGVAGPKRPSVRRSEYSNPEDAWTSFPVAKRRVLLSRP